MDAKKNVVAKRVALIVVILLAMILAAGIWYVNDYSHAEAAALATAEDLDGTEDGVSVVEVSDGALAFEPEQPCAGFIFYPGAKIQPESYAPFLTQCAREGILCILVKPPFNMAILNTDAAKGLQARYPDVDNWLIGGHSMGGVAASDYAARHSGDFEGIVFLASYPACDLSAFDGQVLSINGTEDGVLNRDNYENAKALMPIRFKEIVIDGGNHAGFACYGAQANDYPATITPEEQQRQVVQEILSIAS